MLNKGRKIFCIIVLSVLMLIGSWIVESCPYPLFDDISLISFVEQMRGEHNDFDWNNVTCVNIAYEKITVGVEDALLQEEVGHTSITDRDSLLKFLRIIDGANYKELFIDVRFPRYLDGNGISQYKLKPDSATSAALFSQIKKMPRTLLAHHEGIELEDSTLLPKSAIADYRSTVFTGFARYEYIQSSGKSVALRMYEDMDNRSLNRCGFLAFDGWRPCRNAQFVRFPQNTIVSHIPDNGLVCYPLLSSQLFRENTAEDIRRLVDGKVVLIGDFESDVHTTYAGDVAGPMLNYLAYRELHEGRHFMGWFELVRLLFFMIILFFLLYEDNLIKRKAQSLIPFRTKFAKWPLLRFLLSFFGVSLFVAGFKIVIAWWWFGTSMSVFAASLTLTIIHEIHRYKTEYNNII